MASYLWPDRLTVRQMMELTEYEKLTDCWISLYDEANNESYRIPVLQLIGGTVTVGDGDTYTIGDSDGTLLINYGTVLLTDPDDNAGRVLYIKKTSRGGSVVIKPDDSTKKIDDRDEYVLGGGRLDCARLVAGNGKWNIT